MKQGREGRRESSEGNGKFAKLTPSFVPPEEYLRERTVHGPGSLDRARDSYRGRGRGQGRQKNSGEGWMKLEHIRNIT